MRYSSWALPLLAGYVAATSSTSPPVLKPINPDAFNLAAGIRVRDVADYSRLDPVNMTNLIYGMPGRNDTMLLANMTLYAPDGQQIVHMEAFEGLTKAVDCNDDDGVLSLTFDDENAYKYALDKWSYINEDKDMTFLLITNHDGCGPAEQRAAYSVCDVHNDDANFITYFNATPMAWKNVSSTFDMDFGQATLTSSAARKLRSRSWISNLGNTISGWADDVADAVSDVADDVADAATDVASDVSNLVQGNVELDDKQFDISLAAGTPNTTTHLYTTTIDAATISLDCTNCFIAGSLLLVGSLKVEHLSLKQFSLDMSPQSLNAAVEISTTVSFTQNESATASKEFTLFSFAVPDAGFEVPGIFKVGAFLELVAGTDLTMKESFTFVTGMTVSVPDTAKVSLDLVDLDASASATGFDGSTLTPILEPVTAKIELSGDVYLAPKISLELNIYPLDSEATVGLQFDLPKVTADAEIVAPFGAGACGRADADLGVSLNLDASLAIVATAEGKLASLLDKTWSKTLWSHDLFNQDYCFPIGGTRNSSTTSSVLAIDAPTATSVLPSATGVLPSATAASNFTAASNSTGPTDSVASANSTKASYSTAASNSTGIFSQLSNETQVLASSAGAPAAVSSTAPSADASDVIFAPAAATTTSAAAAAAATSTAAHNYAIPINPFALSYGKSGGSGSSLSSSPPSPTTAASPAYGTGIGAAGNSTANSTSTAIYRRRNPRLYIA